MVDTRVFSTFKRACTNLNDNISRRSSSRGLSVRRPRCYDSSANLRDPRYRYFSKRSSFNHVLRNESSVRCALMMDVSSWRLISPRGPIHRVVNSVNAIVNGRWRDTRDCPIVSDLSSPIYQYSITSGGITQRRVLSTSLRRMVYRRARGAPKFTEDPRDYYWLGNTSISITMFLVESSLCVRE